MMLAKPLYAVFQKLVIVVGVFIRIFLDNGRFLKMFVNRAILHLGRRGFSQVQKVRRSTAVVNELVEMYTLLITIHIRNTATQFKDYLQKQEDGLSMFARNNDEVYARRFELAKLYWDGFRNDE